jgi:GntR family transcriptional repressor for pyruvate dehydrogenase complex
VWGSAIQPARRRSLPDEIVDQILELVATGRLPDNQLPTERELAVRFQVSRSSLREALAALTHLEVVETRGKTKYVDAVRAQAQLAARSDPGDPEQALVSDPSETRQLLEPEVAAKAAERASARNLAEVERWLERMKNATGKRLVECDSAFHVAIARATGNRMLVYLVSALADAMQTSRELSLESPGGVEVSFRGHRRILDALRARDPTRARREMRRHLEEVERLVRLGLEASNSG